MLLMAIFVVWLSTVQCVVLVQCVMLWASSLLLSLINMLVIERFTPPWIRSFSVFRRMVSVSLMIVDVPWVMLDGDEWIDGRTNGWIGGCINRWVDGWMHGFMD